MAGLGLSEIRAMQNLKRHLLLGADPVFGLLRVWAFPYIFEF